MAGFRGYIQGQNAGVNTSFAWPAGTAAGDLCWLYTGGSLPQTGPKSPGWTPVGHKAWWKILTPEDIASPLVVTAERIKNAIFFGAEKIGNTSQQNSVRVGADDFMIVDASRASGACTPDGTYRLGTEWTSTTGNTQATLMRNSATAGTLSIPINPGVEAFAYQVASEALPLAPTLQAPSTSLRLSTLDRVRFSWLHRGGTQRYAIVELVGPMGTRTIMTDGTLYNGTWNLPAIQAITLTVGLAAGTYTWRARTQNYTGLGPWSSPITFYVDVPPTVGTPTVTSPAGTLTPRVVSTVSAGYGNIEQTRVTIAPAASANPEADAIWTSGVRVGSTVDETAPATAPWTNGQSLRAWVTAWQTGGISTTTVSAPFTVSWTPTANPTVTLTAGSPPTVTVGGLASGRRVEVEQHLGGVWSPLTIRTATGTTLTVGSPLLAVGTPVKVRARQAALASGVWLWSAWVETAIATLPPVGCFLVDDADRSVYLEAHIAEEGPREVVQGISVTYGLGATSARVDQTPEAGQRGDMVLTAETTAEVAAINAWLRDHALFWFMYPPEGTTTMAPQRPVRMRRVTPRQTQRPSQTALLQHRRLPLSWVEAPERSL